MDWPFLIAIGAILVGLAIYGWRARRTSPINRWFALQTLCLAGWITGVGGTHSALLTEFWGRWTFTWASLMPAAFLGFTRVFPETTAFPSAVAVRGVTLMGLGLALLSLSSNWIAYDFVITSTGLRRQAGYFFPLFMLYFVVTSASILIVLIRKWRRSRGQARAQLQFYLVGLSILTVCGVTTNLILPMLTGHSEYSRIGPFFVLPMVGLIGHAIIRHRLFDLRLILGRGASYTLFIIGASGLLALIVKSLGIMNLSDIVPIPLFIAVSLLVTFLSLSLPIAPFINRIIDAYLLRGRPDLDDVLKHASIRLTRLLTIDEITTEITTVLTSTLAPEFVRVVKDPTTMKHSDNLETLAWQLEASSPRVIVVQADRLERNVHDALRRAYVEVVVALGRGGARSAIFLIGPKRDGSAYLSPTLRFLEDLAEVGSLALEVAQLHLRQIYLERERQRLANLARMGRLYAGLGHEIRTPLTTISNLVSLLPERLDDPEFRDVMVRLIPTEVRRIAELAERLRALAPSARLVREPVSLNRTIDDLVSIITPVASTKGITLSVTVPPSVPLIYGDSKRLTQLLQNLVVNAMDAMSQGGQVWIRLSEADNSLVLQVIDDGEGISQDMEESIFEAFVTTKASGLGLGLSICQEVAREHGAQLTLRNRTDGRGAIAETVFPLSELPYPATASAIVESTAEVMHLGTL